MKIMYKRIISVFVVIVWMGVIFFLSSMSGHESNAKSKGTIEKVITKVSSNQPEDTTGQKSELISVVKNTTSTQQNQKNKIVEKLNPVLRKCMHATVYFVLSLFIFYMVRVHNLSVFKAFLIACAVTFVYACSDEFHQTFVVGRTGQFTDVLIDTAGALLGLFVCNAIVLIKNVHKYLSLKRLFGLNHQGD